MSVMFSIQPHATARDKAVSTTLLAAGTVILSTPSLAPVLVRTEKGRRCDYCLSLEPRLQRCTGCASYWYCDAKCQTLHWRTHKKYCKNISAFCASARFNQLEAHDKMDALFLTHLLAECSASNADMSSHLSTFMTLLPGPGTANDVPPTCPLSTRQHCPVRSVSELFSRCCNNNFSIHSHLTTIAHAAFPLASRSFNHSCVPNAVAKYTLARAQEVIMHVVAIRDIAPGEEICIPYLDPALLETRQHMFRFTYGFTCSCPSCTAFKRVDLSWPLPDEDELGPLGTALCAFVFPNLSPDAIALPSVPFELETVPIGVLPILRESCLARLCASFSTRSHEGPFESALEVGLVVLAFYVVIYPPNYPQIGMHLLEMAKTAWNALVMTEGVDPTSQPVLKLRAHVQAYLELGKQVWAVIGPEGDQGGPLAEIQALERLLREIT